MKRLRKEVLVVISLAAIGFVCVLFTPKSSAAITPVAATKALAAAAKSQSAAWKSHYYFKAAEAYYEASTATSNTGSIIFKRGDKLRAKQLLKESQRLSRQGDYYYGLAEKYRKEALRKGLGGLLKLLGH